MSSPNIPHRPLRLSRTGPIRAGVAETQLHASQLIQPLFVVAGKGQSEEIQTMPGQFRLSGDLLKKEIHELLKLGIHQVALFPVIAEGLKTSSAKEALNAKGLVPETVRDLRREFGEDLVIVTDVALDPYSSDGHDGLVKDGVVLNDESVQVLAQMALVLAEAGSDFVAPSDMMDGRVGQIRQALEANGFLNTGIIAYTAKYASAFYGPFRDALDSAPRFGDKKTYQMDPRNVREAVKEAKLDIKEGADILMVKPGLPYLDIISLFKRTFPIPIAAYSVSGEYAMIKFAARAGALDEVRAVDEMLMSLRRAGSDLIFTYFGKQWAQGKQS